MAADLKKFTQDLIAARKAAETAIAGVADTGICNFDGVYITVGKGSVFARRSKSLEAAVAAAGCELTKNYRGGCQIRLQIKTGQGWPNTLAVETARDHLKAAGWPAFVRHYTD